MSRPSLHALVVVFGLCAASSAFADVEQQAADALASVPAGVRLAVDISDSAYPEVQLRSLRELELEGMKLAQASAPAPDVAAPLVRVTSFKDETRVFWFSAGASAITSLATRVLLIIPMWVVIGLATVGTAPLLGPVATFVIVLGAVAGFSIADSAAAAAVSSLVFDNASDFFTSSFLASFGGHLTGNALAAGVMWLSVGFGGMLLFGLDALSAFTTGTALSAIALFSVLGTVPVFVVAFLASVALPALIGTWATAVTAKPREGYVIDPTWRPLASAPGSPRALPEERFRVPMRSLVSVAIPGT